MAATCGTGTGNFPQPGDPDLNGSILSAVPAFGGIDISWTYPELNSHAVAHTILYRSTNSDPSTKIRRRVVTGDFHHDRITTDINITYYYWIQMVSVNETVGELIGPASAQARPTIEDMIELLSNQINNGLLAQSLKDEISKIETNKQDILTEKLNRINADGTISLAFGELDQNVSDLDSLIVQEITERQEADTSIINNVNLLFTQSNDNNALIVQEQIARASADDALAADIETLQVQAGNNTASIQNEQTARADADAALAQQISTLSAASSGIHRSPTAPDPATVNLAENDLWVDTSDNNHLYQWDGTEWLDAQDGGIAGAFAAVQTEETARIQGDNALSQQISTVETSLGQKSRTFFQSIPPVADNINDIWVDTDNDNLLSVWDGSNWVSAADARIAQALADAAQAQQDATQALADALAAQNAADDAIRTFYQDTAPTGLNNTTDVGDLWFDTDDNIAYRWDGANWILVQDSDLAVAIQAAQDAQATADGKITTFYQGTAPTAEGVGDLWINTSNNNRWSYWDGSSWVDSTDGRIATALQNAANAQSTADGKIESFWQNSAPTASGVGDIWFDTGNSNRPYRWDGSLWRDARDSDIATALQTATDAQSTADGKVTTFYQPAAPTATGVGDLWIDTDNENRLHRWNSASWVDISDPRIANALQAASNAEEAADGKIASFWQNAAPTGASLGDLWFDTDDGNHVYRWNGTSWQDAQDSGIAQAVTAATNAIDTADGKVTTFYQGTPPTAEGTGDLWIDTANGNRMNRWTGSNWVNVQDSGIAIGMGRNKVFRQASPPTAQNTGDIWFESDNDDKAYRWTGTVWKALNLYTGNEVNAAVEDKTKTMVGYCLVGGSPDTSYETPTECVAAGGEWLVAEPVAEAVRTAEVSNGAESASVQELMTTYRDALDTLNAEYTVKVQTNVGGETIVGGFGLATETGTGTVEAGFDVDRFWVGKIGNKRYPFIIENGEVFISQAAIKDLTIQKLRDESGNFVIDSSTGKFKADYFTVTELVSSATNPDGTPRFRFTEQGEFEMTSVNADGGRVVQNGDGILVIDENSRVRVRIGRLS